MASKPLRCSLRQCIQGELDGTMARVEVKSYEVNPEESRHMEVAWTEYGEAVFHDICWKATIDSLKMDNPFSLSSLEKDIIAEAKKTAEYFDSVEKVKLEANRIASFLKSSNYAIAFTGAGVSTSSGIGDFRGKTGKWTERDREKKHGAGKQKSNRDFIFETLRPSYSHEAIAKLLELGYIKHVISQNTDGLHRLSGIPRDKISELHGNSFHERCEKCGTRYERSFAVRRPENSKVPPRICVHCHFDHRTGRSCERKGCDGYLMNCIIHFGDSLEKRVLSLAEEQAKRANMVLCLGSSLRVTPACELIDMGLDPRRIVICNRQPTPFDKLCYATSKEDPSTVLGSRVFGNCDELLSDIMSLLLPSEVLKEWEDGREARREEYDSLRHKIE